MTFTAYEITPIDFGWETLSTVSETAAKLGSEDAVSRVDGDPQSAPFYSLDTFLADWETAKQLASEAGWEGDFRGEPRVFWLPTELEIRYGFVFKQDNNGTTYVISPCALPHLKM